MKKTFTTVAAVALLAMAPVAANAEEFVVPEPEIIVPIFGEAELLNNMVEVTWGYYGLEDNAGDDPIQGTITFPDGTVKTVKGEIADANKEGVIQGAVPTTVRNALMFRNFMELDEETMMYVQQYGTYTLSIPAAVVLVNGVANDAAELSFKITGLHSEQSYMSPAVLTYPSSYNTSFLSLIELSWGEEISFVDPAIDSEGNEYVEIEMVCDAQEPQSVKATIEKVIDSGEDDTQNHEYYMLYISLPDFLMYAEVSTVDFIIDEGIVANKNGEINPSQVVTFHLMETIFGSVEPADGSELEEGFAKVTVSWDGIQVSAIEGIVVAKNNSGEIQIPLNIEEEGVAITLDLSELSEGNYEIMLPEGLVVFLKEESDGADVYAMSSEMYLNYKIVAATDGISIIEGSENANEIYNLNGVRVNGNNLSKGMYIVNGKKVAVTK